MGEFALGRPMLRFEDPRLLRAGEPHDRSPARHSVSAPVFVELGPG